MELKSPVQQGLEGVDELVHEPRRFALLNVLAGLEYADYMYLMRLTGLTSGNLTRHLGKLEEAGLVEITKEFVLKRPKTRVRITAAGRQAEERHWRQLETLRERARHSREDE